jgi:hypothetical protein
MQEAKQELVIKLAQEGVFGSEVEPTIEKIYNSIPEATRSQYNEDRDAAVLEFWPIYVQSKQGGSNPAQVQTQDTASPVAVLSAQTAKTIKTVMEKDKSNKIARTAKTTVKKLLIDKPAPKEFLKEDMKIIPICKTDKLNEYEKKLDKSDPANLEAFKVMKAAVENKTEMPIYINEGANKVVGYEIETLSKEAGTEVLETKTYTSEGTIGFLATEVEGYIPTRANGLGLKLRWNKPRPSKKSNARKSLGAPQVVTGGKQEALKDANLHTVISKIETANGQNVTKDGKLRTKMSFKIDTGEKNTNGEAILRTIRFTGTAKVPKFIRINDEMTKLFGSSEKDRSIITPPTLAEADELEEVMIKSIAFMSENGANRFNIAGFAESMAQATVPSDPAAGVALD